MEQREKWIIYTVSAKPEEFLSSTEIYYLKGGSENGGNLADKRQFFIDNFIFGELGNLVQQKRVCQLAFLMRQSMTLFGLKQCDVIIRFIP